MWGVVKIWNKKEPEDNFEKENEETEWRGFAHGVLCIVPWTFNVISKKPFTVTFAHWTQLHTPQIVQHPRI